MAGHALDSPELSVVEYVCHSLAEILRILLETARLFSHGTRGGVRRGLGGYSSRRSMLAPPSEGEKRFFGDFWHL